MEQLSFDDLARGLVPAPVPAPDDAPEPEDWRDVVGYEGLYLVSSLGRVWSVPRLRKDGRHQIGGHLMRPCQWRSRTTAGRIVLRLVLVSGDGAKKGFAVHRLVAAAFLGQCPPGQIVRHGPNGCLDNRASQLSHGTHKQNSGPDRERDGTLLSGEDIAHAKLTVEIVGECRRRYAAGGVSTAKLAAEFGVDRRVMDYAISGRNWKSCPVPPVPANREGEAHCRAVLTREIVIDARRRHAGGETVAGIAKAHGVSYVAIWKVIQGITWKSVTADDAA